MNRTLNRNLWDINTLRPKIKKHLLAVANDFLADHIIPENAVEDIILTGSLANYNWTKYSDIDLHIIVDLDSLEDDKELLQHYYRLAKSVWNNNHEINICGHEVEIYIQNVKEPHHSTGVYSLLNDKWIQKPQNHREEPSDPQIISNKFQDLASRIDSVVQKVANKDSDSLDVAQKLKDKIKKMRSSGLTDGGEYSYENLAFKKLRNSGYLRKLSDAAKAAYDQQFELTNCTRK
jgi:predicted nucleotidyltransferase